MLVTLVGTICTNGMGLPGNPERNWTSGLTVRQPQEQALEHVLLQNFNVGHLSRSVCT